MWKTLEKNQVLWLRIFKILDNESERYLKKETESAHRGGGYKQAKEYLALCFINTKLLQNSV